MKNYSEMSSQLEQTRNRIDEKLKCSGGGDVPKFRVFLRVIIGVTQKLYQQRPVYFICDEGDERTSVEAIVID